MVATETFKKDFPKLGRKYLGAPGKRMGRRVFGRTDISHIRSGNGSGNNTAWRMALDLNRGLRYADGVDILRDVP